MWQNLGRAKPTCRDVLPAACFWVLSHASETGRGETAHSLQNLGSGRGGWQERDLSLVRSPVASHHYWCLVLRQLRCVFTGCLGHGAVVWCHVACRRHHRVVTRPNIKANILDADIRVHMTKALSFQVSHDDSALRHIDEIWPVLVLWTRGSQRSGRLFWLASEMVCFNVSASHAAPRGRSYI